MFFLNTRASERPPPREVRGDSNPEPLKLWGRRENHHGPRSQLKEIPNPRFRRCKVLQMAAFWLQGDFWGQSNCTWWAQQASKHFVKFLDEIIITCCGKCARISCLKAHKTEVILCIFFFTLVDSLSAFISQFFPLSHVLACCDESSCPPRVFLYVTADMPKRLRSMNIVILTCT